MTNKETYLRLNTKELPLFHRPYWLSAVAGENWDVVILKEGEEVIATMPYAFKKNVSGLYLNVPVLTQFLGPYFSLHAESPREKINRETEILTKLEEHLPVFATSEMRWHFDFQNWLPFYWKRYSQTSRYTYVLTDLKNKVKLWNNFSEKIRREIKKGEQHFQLTTENIVIDDFYSLIKENLDTKNYKITFDKHLLNGLYQSCLENKSGRIFSATDANGKMAAAIFIAWDHTTAYYIIGSKKSDSGNSGAMSFLFWNAFEQLSNYVDVFDFEGSMIQGVESYFRSFGAEQRIYHQIFKINSLFPFIKQETKTIFNFIWRKK